ncbi:MAG: hypothetical protein JKY65_19470, partial [Planctomycetes bacterium]|nr:hypothetical protein [Planctomycetota bacterium]
KKAADAAAVKKAADAAAAKKAADAAAAKKAADAAAAKKATAKKAADAAAAKKAADAAAAKKAADVAAGRKAAAAAKIAEARKTPEGLAKLLYKAISDGDARLFKACWLTLADTKSLLGKRNGTRWFKRAKRERLASWAALLPRQNALRSGRFQAVDAPLVDVKFGSKTLKRIKNGSILYFANGRQEKLPLAALFQLKDGTWKAFALVKAARKAKKK